MGRVAVIGAGWSGAVIARELACAGHHIHVFESREHIAGNCHTKRDADTGVMYHVHGPHIFHTDNERVWSYVRQFGEFVPYNHHVKATVHGRVYSMPINLHTINQFFAGSMGPREAQLYITNKCRWPAHAIQTFEEQALAHLGPELYEAFLCGYTRKQWGREPSTLPASILKRLPLRFDYNDSYFAHPHQAIPRHGYTAVVAAILDHPNIVQHLNVKFTSDMAARQTRTAFEHFFYSGPLDEWFNYSYGRLAYRTLDFAVERAPYDILGCPVMNYCDESVPYTRRTDFKHFMPWESNTKSFVYREFSREAKPGDNLYYPVRLADDNTMLAQYLERATGERRVTFVGRLGTYRYLDMDVTIAQALAAADKFLGRASHG